MSALSPETYDAVARRFRVLGEPARLALLATLMDRGETTVHDLVAATGQGQPSVSKHLRVLLDEGLVGRRRAGAFVSYWIADPTLPGLCALVCGGLGDRASGQAA